MPHASYTLGVDDAGTGVVEVWAAFARHQVGATGYIKEKLVRGDYHRSTTL